MIRLNSTQKLQAVLSAAVATNQPQAVVCYSDQTTTTYNGGTTTSNLNSTTPVDIVSAPAASTIRDVDFISIYNKDTASVTVGVFLDSAVPVQLVSVILDTGASLEYTHGSGWKVVNADNVVTSVFGETGVITQLPYVQFNTLAGVPSYNKGITYWDEPNHTLSTDLADGVRLQHGQEVHLPCLNNTGVSIGDGKAVYISGASGDHPTIALARADSTTTSDSLIGMTTQVIANGDTGLVTIIGAVRDIDTSTLSLGPVYLSPSTAGALTSTRPSYPDRIIRVGFCTNVNATTGRVVVYTEDYADAQDILLPHVGTPTEIVDVLDWFRHSWSTGLTDSGDITNNGDGTVNIAASDFLLRQGSNEDDPLYVYRNAGTTNFALTDNDVNYVYLDYNAGTPTWNKATSLSGFNGIDKVIAYVIARNGTRLNILDLRKINVDSGRKNRRQKVEFDGYIYNGFWRSSLAQSSVSATGLTLQVATGKYFYFDNPISHTAFDTSVAGAADANNFIYFYNRTGTWTQQTGQKSINATQYDVAGTLTTMNNNKYRTDWVFVVLCGSNPYLAVILGNTEYASLAAAQAEAAPTTLPPQIDGAAVLIGQVCILKSAASVTIRNAGASGFSGSSAVDWANPGTIGATTPNSGAFTTLSATGDVTITGSAKGLRVANSDNGYTTLSSAVLSAAAVKITSGAMNTTAKYVAPIVFGSTDTDFTTANPKWGAAITAYALEAFTADTAGGMGLEFFGLPTAPGAAQPTLTSLGTWNTSTGLSISGALSSTGNVTLGDATTDTLNVGNGGIVKDSSGQVGIGLTPTARNNTRLQLVDGIGFPATQVASSDANTLDDYEEGTFTPTISGQSTAGAGTYTTQVGFYTKIGNQVTAHVIMTWTAHTGTGNALLTGLPFTSNSTSARQPSIAIGYLHNYTLTANNVATGHIVNNTAQALLLQYPVGGGASTQVALDTAGSIQYSVTYEV